MKQDSKPSALLILILIMMVFLQQASGEVPWSPPYLGRDVGWTGHSGTENSLYLDTMGLTNLPSLSFLPDSLPHLKPDQLLRVTPSGSEVVRMTRQDGQVAFNELYRGFPRAKVEQRSDSYRLSTELYQPKVGRNLFVGPIDGWVDTELYRPNTVGISLGALTFLPRRTERAVLLDSRGLRLPKDLRARLMEQWKRWEFEPYVSLANAFGPSFCYAEWQGGSLVVADIKSLSAVENVLSSRFPPRVVDMASTWSFGTTIWGFEKTTKPAWMLRGDRFLATPDGGTDRIARMMSERYERDCSFLAESPLLKELQRLASLEKGWHLCIIEQRPSSQLHWAALLNWPEAGGSKVEGHLVVWLPPEPIERDRVLDSSI
jgi:hypothetical protein